MSQVFKSRRIPIFYFGEEEKKETEAGEGGKDGRRERGKESKFVEKKGARIKLPLLSPAMDGLPLPLQIHSPPSSVPRKTDQQGSH